jgi:hypothetical protein
MPQNQLYEYDVKYNGYVFKLRGYREPTAEEVHKIYVDSVLAGNPFDSNTPSLDIGMSETDFERAERSSDEIGSLQPDRDYQDATFGQRFWESAKLAAVPHFGLMESRLSPADESSEIWAEALGGLGGAVAGMIPFSLIGGGVPGIAVGGANVVKKYRHAAKLFDLARKAQKLGKNKEATKLLDKAESFARSNNKLFSQAIRSKSFPSPTGILGKTKPYREYILKSAEKNPKYARALNLFANNVVTFGLYGQSKMPYDKLEGRLEQFGADAAASAIFSVAGLPTMLGHVSKGVKYGVEPGLLMGAGMYSDAGQSDMTMEERLIHGASLVAFHYARQVIGEAHIREKIGTAFRLADPSLSDANVKSIRDSNMSKNISSAALKYVNENVKYRTYSQRNNPDRTVQLLKIEKPSEDGPKKHRIVFQDLNTSQILSIEGDTYQQASKNFRGKFSENIPPGKKRVIGKDLNEEQLFELRKLKDGEKELRDALQSPRSKEVYELSEVTSEENIKNPFHVKIGVEEVKFWGSKVDSYNKDIESLKQRRAGVDKDTSVVNKTRKRNVIDKEIESLERGKTVANEKLRQAYKSVQERSNENFDPLRDEFEIGDNVKIPKFDETTGKLDYTKAGIGKYVGRMKDFKPGEVIAPEWMQSEPTKNTSYFKDIPVFEVKTHGGSRVERVAIGGKIPEKVSKAITSAQSIDRPMVEYAKDNNQIKEIAENPVIAQTGGKIQSLEWNPKSRVFKTIFQSKPKGPGPGGDRTTINFQKEGMVPRSRGEMLELAKNLGFKDTETMSNIGLEVRAFKRHWDENIGSYFGAKTKKPYEVSSFESTYEHAKDMGFKGSKKDLWDFAVNFSREVPGIIKESYTAYAPSRLKKVKLSDGSKPFPDGIPTMEGAMRLEADMVESVRSKLEVRREQERKRFHQFKEADESQWPNMNNMPKDITIDKSTYESYPEFDPKNDKPWAVRFVWDSRKANEITTKKRRAMRNGKVARFKTKEEAEQFALDHWMNQEAIEKHIDNKIRHISALEGAEYSEINRQRGRLKEIQRKEGISQEDYKYILNEFFPESNGSSLNMTHEELQVASAYLSNAGNTKVYQDKMSSMVPPADIISRIKSNARKLFIGVAKKAFPIYTTLQLANSRISNIWSRKMVTHEITRQIITGDFSEFKVNLKKAYKINKKKDFENLSSILDKKFEDWYDPKMDKYPIEDIQRAYKLFQHKVVAEYLIPSGMMVRNAGTPGAKYELLFEAYDGSGGLIELANGYDAVRLVEGIDFLDSQGRTKVPESGEVPKIVKGVVVTTKGEGIPFEYLKSLRTMNEDTGKYDGGWFIKGKDRFIIEWKDENTAKTTRLDSKTVETKDGKYVKVHDKDGNPGKFKHNIEKDYLTRIITDEFRELMADGNILFREGVADIVSKTDPDFVNMNATQAQKHKAALDYINNIDKFWRDQAGVFGTQYTRVANLPPIIAFESGTNYAIQLSGFKDINGKPISKNSTVIDVKGQKKSVGKIVNVYERNFDKIISRQGQKIAHIVPTFKLFGKRGAQSDEVKRELNELALETDESFATWAHEALSLQINAVQKNQWYDGPLRSLTMISAQIGLSSPLSGYKNFVLGQQSNATVFGFRQSLNGMFRAMADPKAMSNLTGRIGGKEAGVHEIMSGRIVYAKYNPGMMRQTEVMNRIISTSIGEPALKAHIDNLGGVKNVMNKGVSRKTSFRTMSDVFKFTDAEISEMVKLGSHRLYKKPEYIERAQSMAHLITQGGPSLPFVPLWMGKNWAKPLTLFYRVAYRMTENVANSVIKPLVADGNPIPMARYISMLPVSGAAIFGAHYLLLGEEQRNRFKGKADQFFELAIKAEGLGVASNAFDEYGNVIESYQPAVWRAVKSLGINIWATALRKKFVPQAFEDLATENVVLLNRVVKLYEKSNKPLVKAHNDSRRRQRQFTDVYFRNRPYLGDELSSLTEKSPYYRAVKEVFWTDDAEEKARVYYAARNYIAQHEINKDPSLKKLPHKAIKLAKKNLNTIKSAQRPVPTSWRKRTTGAKTRYEIYMSKIDPETRRKEQYIENEYKKKLRDFNSAISKYSTKYNKDPFPGPSK